LWWEGDDRLVSCCRQLKPRALWESKAEIAKGVSVVLAWRYSRNDRWKSIVAGWIIFSEPEGGDWVWRAERADRMLFIRWEGMPVSVEKSNKESGSCRTMIAPVNSRKCFWASEVENRRLRALSYSSPSPLLPPT
jgi:hypothetical protein